jgi:hypothetical protein
MKTMVSFFLVAGGLAACSHSATSPDAPPIPKKFVSWSVSGTEVITGNYLAGTGSTGQLPDRTVRVGGRVFRGGHLIADVELEVPPAIGTYTFGPNSAAWATYETAGSLYEAGTVPGGSTAPGSGTVVVTDVSDRHIAGTFTFTGIERTSGTAKTVTNGRFFVLE